MVRPRLRPRRRDVRGGQFVEVCRRGRGLHGPAAPVQIALLSAVPIPDPVRERERRRIRLSGELPDLTQPVVGCIFASRCWKAQERCVVERPALVERGATANRTARHFPENVA